jgi:hypothetical protein
MSAFSAHTTTGSKASKTEPPPFSPHPGPAHLHDPLGHSSLQDHYITPVPPMYVTEYEDAYKWPVETSA